MTAQLHETGPLSRAIAFLLSLAALLLTGAIAGFFYAYFCSVMWGLDASSPKAALATMQGINATVRNAAFAPAFFGTPVASLAAALALLVCRCRLAAMLMLASACVYCFGAFWPTFAVNVPMNEALAGVSVPEDPAEAARLWADYAEPWKWWNGLRAAFSFVSLACAGAALWFARPKGQAFS